MRFSRSLLMFKVGVWAGLVAAAAFARQAVPSRGDEDSEELALVAILDGIDLKSRAESFKGGSMLAWFGGIAVDLRETGLAPGARLSVRTLAGGVAVRTPPGWRIKSEVKALAGGIETGTPAGDDPDAPVLVVDGLAVFGGVAIGAKAGPSG